MLIKNTGLSAARLSRLAEMLCDRQRGIGADGLLAARKKRGDIIELKYFNSDGSQAFCGNGSRCCAWWAYSTGLIKSRKMTIETSAGNLDALIIKNELVRIRMPDVRGIKILKNNGEFPKETRKIYFLNTGVPHAVAPVRDIDKLDVDFLGRILRRHAAFAPEGANADFISVRKNALRIRTYERGAEAETRACGTGAIAAAVALGLCGRVKPPVTIIPRSGENLRIWFRIINENTAACIYLQGPAKIIFSGKYSS